LSVDAGGITARDTRVLQLSNNVGTIESGYKSVEANLKVAISAHQDLVARLNKAFIEDSSDQNCGGMW